MIMMILNTKRMRGVRNLFNGVALNRIALNQSTGEDYYNNQKKKKLILLLMIITSNTKAKGTKIRIYHLKNILI